MDWVGRGGVEFGFRFGFGLKCWSWDWIGIGSVEVEWDLGLGLSWNVVGERWVRREPRRMFWGASLNSDNLELSQFLVEQRWGALR